jgi:DNA repair protein RadC
MTPSPKRGPASSSLYSLLHTLIGRRAAMLISQPLMEVLLLDPEAMARRTGITPGDAKALSAAVELGRRVLAHSASSPVLRLDDVPSVAAYLLPLLSGLETEAFGVIGLSSRLTLTAERILSTGTADATIVDPNDVVRFALDTRSSSVIVFHNHPSGDPTPSDDDLKLEWTLRARLMVFDIELLDFLIIASRGGHYYSASKHLTGLVHPPSAPTGSIAPADGLTPPGDSG